MMSQIWLSLQEIIQFGIFEYFVHVLRLNKQYRFQMPGFLTSSQRLDLPEHFQQGVVASNQHENSTLQNILTLTLIFFSIFLFNWDSLHARLNSHYEAWSYKKKKHKKD